MAANPPYLYDPPSSRRSNMNPTYDFDPKAVTRASWSQASINSSPRPKQDGPLIDFNRHPDSYVIIPYGGNNDLPPLPANTKTCIVVIRWLQFALRLLQEIGALGLLACLICIQGIDDVQSWILRIPPAWDALICCYAVYHLLRPANARTPMSSASYHVFSLFMDIGMIPFMVVNAFFTQNQWSMDSAIDGRWTSFFDTSDTNKLLLVTWILAIAVGALHLFSIGIDIYLVIIFRKIARYPPDSSPLEDSRASRMARKHAHKNSEMAISVSEKRFASMSGSTLNLNRPTSTSLLADKLVPDANVRPISFYQSRQNLDQSYSAHTQESARMSRANLYQQSPATSRTDLNARGGRNHSRPSSTHSRSQSRSQSRPRSQGGAGNRASHLSEHDPMPSRPMSFITGSNGPSRYSSPLPGPQAHIPTNVAKLQQKEGLLNDNWYAFPEADDGDLSSPRRTPQPPQHTDIYSDDDEEEQRNPNLNQLEFSKQEELDLLPQPLSTKPPTPPQHKLNNEYNDGNDSADNGAFFFSDMPSTTLDSYGNSHDSSLPTQSYLDNAKTLSYDNVKANANDYDDNANANSETKSAHNSEGTIGRALTLTSAISAVSSLYSQGNTPNMSRASSPKRKAYGDLASATAGVLGQSGSASQLSIPKQQQQQSDRGKSHSRERREAEEARVLQRGHVEKGGRVISRTGVDLADASVMYIGSEPSSANASQKNSFRGRQVSGKIAEEGRAGPKNGGGWFGSALRRREVSGSA